MAKGEFKDALTRIDECLKQRPISSYAYMLRSNISAALGNEHASVEDIREAVSLNPLDGTIARENVNILCRRDQKLGDNISSDQMVETRGALTRAIELNPYDIELRRLYAEYITPADPSEAMAVRQELQRVAPTIENAILLGQLATKMAVKETDSVRKEALFGIAGSAFEQARKINPNDRGMLYFYAEYFRARRQDEKATELLQESQDEKLLWSHHFQRGQYEDARRILERLYKSEAKDSAVLKGLLLVAKQNADREAIKKYSEELISLEDTVDNRLAQIQFFLEIGLIKEAEYKLQSFEEKHPSEPRTLLLQAQLAMRQGQLKKALELTNRNLQSNQNSSVAWRLRGEINFFIGDYDKAIGDLRTSKSLSDEPATRISLARAYMQVDRYEDAITELKIMIDEKGDYLEDRSLLELIYLQLDRTEALKKFYEETLVKFPESAQWLNRAAAFAIDTEEFDRAEQLYKKACLTRRQALRDQDEKDRMRDMLYVAAFDGYLKALLMGAGAPNTRRWDPQKLDKLFEEGIKYKDSIFGSIAYSWMAQAKWKIGDEITAAEYFREAVDKAGTNEAIASEVLLRMYLTFGADEVSRYCREKLRTNPDSIAANFAMFNLAKINEEYDKAIDHIDKCIELTDPDSPSRVNYTGKKADILTVAYDRSSDKEYLRRAIADYESLLAKMPNNTSVLNNLAYLLAESDERLPEALRYAKRALDAKPNEPAVLDTYAYLLCKNGKSSQAVEFSLAALQQYKQDEIPVPAGAYEHLGMIKEDLGAKDEALAAYKQALQAGADALSQKAKQRINKAVDRVSP
jgi:tetratricopeptide (TPR) repeat protein